MIFVDGPTRPAIVHERHPMFTDEHTLIAWDWDNAQWVSFTIPCTSKCVDHERDWWR